jgi:hypothetical protein
MQGSAIHTWLAERFSMLPISQLMISIAAKGLAERLSARLMPAPASVETATPAKIIVSGLSEAPVSTISPSEASAPSTESSGSTAGCICASPK